MSDRLKIEGKLFLAAWAAYVVVAAITGSLTLRVLAVRCAMAAVTAVLIGIAYRRRPKSRSAVRSGSGEALLENGRARQWRILMWTLAGLVVAAFVVTRIA
jgi:hypothetical protein